MLLTGSIAQGLTPSATSSNPEVLPANSIAFTANGSVFNVTLTLAPDAPGTTILNFFATEGIDTARLIPPFVPVTNAPPPPNLPPTLNPIADVIISEDGGQQTITLSGITSGSPNETQPLLVTVRSGNPSLVPNLIVNYTSPNDSGSVLFLPATDASGKAVITVTVNDGQSQSNLVTRSFTVTVNSVNDPPTLNGLANININKNDGTQTVSLSGITAGPANEAQPLIVTATSSNPSLIPNALVSYATPASTGTLTFAPARDASGSATITVTVNDGGAQNNTFSRSFTVTVNSVNAAPTLDQSRMSRLTKMRRPGLSPKRDQFGSGRRESTLLVTATSSNPSLIPPPSVNYISPWCVRQSRADADSQCVWLCHNHGDRE
jgi:hypothetical protein